MVREPKRRRRARVAVARRFVDESRRSNLTRAQVTTEIGGKKASKLWIEPSFDWRCVCKPIMPGNPDWCPATHFGIIEQGCMKIERDSGVVSIATRLRAISFRSRRARRRAAPRYEDDRPDEEFTAGQTYFVGPGHIPKILGDKTCIMVEFAESANKIYENIDKSD